MRIRWFELQEHHKSNSFKEELLLLLEKYGVAYDEKYLWD
jgi:putative transposase